MPTTNQNAPAGSWAKISDDLQNVLITNKSMTTVHVYVGTAAPDANSAYHDCTYDQPFGMSGIVGQDIWIRSAGTSAVSVTVTAV